jgi:hypothetical protein
LAQYRKLASARVLPLAVPGGREDGFFTSALSERDAGAAGAADGLIEMA